MKESYITIQSWMVDELNLKGNDLLIYAIIYGFSQDGETRYAGGRQYLADWTSSSKRAVQRNLNNLLERGLIKKEEVFLNKVKMCKYYAILDIAKDKLSLGVGNLCHQGEDKMSPNNTIYNINNNIYSPTDKRLGSESISEIVEYLNSKTNKKFSSKNSKTRSLIESRFREGFTVEDFKRVIDIKVEEWSKDSNMAVYLRPQTLFSNKFESYLNQEIKEKKDDTEYFNFF